MLLVLHGLVFEAGGAPLLAGDLVLEVHDLVLERVELRLVLHDQASVVTVVLVRFGQLVDDLVVLYSLVVVVTLKLIIEGHVSVELLLLGCLLGGDDGQLELHLFDFILLQFSLLVELSDLVPVCLGIYEHVVHLNLRLLVPVFDLLQRVPFLRQTTVVFDQDLVLDRGRLQLLLDYLHVLQLVSVQDFEVVNVVDDGNQQHLSLGHDALVVFNLLLHLGDKTCIVEGEFARLAFHADGHEHLIGRRL